MSAYTPEPTIMQASDMFIALTQHQAQHPLALVAKTAQRGRKALKAIGAAETQEDLQAALSTAWDEVGTLEQLATRLHQGVENGVALSSALAEQIRTLAEEATKLLNDLMGNTDRAEWDKAVSIFYERVEAEVNERALELALLNMASEIVLAFGVDEDEAQSFVGLLMGKPGLYTAAALDKVLPQLAAMRAGM